MTSEKQGNNEIAYNFFRKIFFIQYSGQQITFEYSIIVFFSLHYGFGYTVDQNRPCLRFKTHRKTPLNQQIIIRIAFKFVVETTTKCHLKLSFISMIKLGLEAYLESLQPSFLWNM